MSRTIQFRGERKDNGEWVYGYYRIGALAGGTYIKDYPVVSETIGQYTGMKDKNGTEIYEGDIVQVWENGQDRDKYEIVFNKGAFCIKQTSESFYALFCMDFDIYQFEVVGNIYDNRELLKEADNA